MLEIVNGIKPSHLEEMERLTCRSTSVCFSPGSSLGALRFPLVVPSSGSSISQRATSVSRTAFPVSGSSLASTWSAAMSAGSECSPTASFQSRVRLLRESTAARRSESKFDCVSRSVIFWIVSTAGGTGFPVGPSRTLFMRLRKSIANVEASTVVCSR